MLSLGTAMAGMRSWLKRVTGPPVPRHIASHWTPLNATGREVIRESLLGHYFTRDIWGTAEISPEAYLATEAGQKDLSNNLQGRLDTFRQSIIPWLDSVRPLAGSHILEIGCGTGSSTVALAEQGAQVVGVDIDAPSLVVAQDRCRAYGLEAVFVQANATEAHALFPERRFDLVIFFACLEHMTHAERIEAIGNTWQMLSPGAMWCIIETPNRLWYSDLHTAHLPFYHWLPNDLAFAYSRFSPREHFSSSFREESEEAMLSFLRHGRGVSYHELEMAMGRAQELDVVSSLATYQREKSLLRSWAWLDRFRFGHRYEALLARVGPPIHRGFYAPNLDLIIRRG